MNSMSYRKQVTNAPFYRVGPRFRYQQDLDSGAIYPDTSQKAAVDQLQYCFDQLTEPPLLTRQILPWWKLGNRVAADQPQVPQTRGLYLWGPVGRGKTYLMNSFFQCLPPGVALRLHYHRFMKMVHEAMRHYSGHKNPLRLLAADLAREARILCVDEFFVEDIGDAMILSGLLEAIFEHGITLVITSNTAPQDLYKGGLQRHRFVPAISQLQSRTQVMALDGETDYRLRQLQVSKNYFSPLNKYTQSRLLKMFRHLAPEARLKTAGRTPLDQVVINDRSIKAHVTSENVVWFDFMTLCAGPRSQLDYIEISKRFSTVILSKVPRLGGAMKEHSVAIGTEDSDNNSLAGLDRSVQQGILDDAARRFIALVDEFYDQRVRLIISAAVPIEELYQGGRVSFAFQRTVSRLIEMQSEEYLAQCR
jgi:cell division protein ZapE